LAMGLVLVVVGDLVLLVAGDLAGDLAADWAEREREVGAAIGLRYHPASGERRAASKGNADGRAGAPFVTRCRSVLVRRSCDR
jgi:hypothetical protein